jgi:chromosomal replication initiator protein
MTRDPLDTIVGLRNELRERIGADRFELWFGSKVQLHVQGETLEVIAAESFVLERVQRQFHQALREILHRLQGAAWKLVFRVDPQLLSVLLGEAADRGNNAGSTAGKSEPRSDSVPGRFHGRESAQAPQGVGVHGLDLCGGADGQDNVNGAARKHAGKSPEVGLQRQADDASRQQAVEGSSRDQGGQQAGFVLRIASEDGDANRLTASRRGRQFERFETFVVGCGNRLAHSAAQSVAERPGLITPLFFHGPPGSGKTHLLEGIYSTTRAINGARALYLSSEQFTTFFLDALRGGGLPNFRRKVREIDLLIVDDLQFLRGKRATVVELQHTLDVLVRGGRQIVLAADRPPSRLTDLGAELVTRLTGGLVCGIEEADETTRVGLAQRFANESQTLLPAEVIQLLAREFSGDARQLRGACWRLKATSEALKHPIDRGMALEALHDLHATSKRVVMLTDIERAVCEECGISPQMLREESRSRAGSHPRMLAMWLARKYTRAASSEISLFFGRRSHSTVISAEQKVERWKADEAMVQLGTGSCKVSEALKRLEQRLRSAS